MDKVDVFVRCYAMSSNNTSPIRMGMAIACVERWKLQRDINLILMHPVDDQFHMEGKQRAEKQSQGDIYIVADDDTLILSKHFVEMGVNILRNSPEYGLLAATSISDGGYKDNAILPKVVELHSVGGICFVRKGVIKNFYNCKPPDVDTFIYEQVKQAGYKTGVMPAVKFNHLGCGYSLTDKRYWGV